MWYDCDMTKCDMTEMFLLDIGNMVKTHGEQTDKNGTTELVE